MRVDELLRVGLTRSFEYFPPKDEVELATLETTLKELDRLEPSFVSVTFRGSAASRERTFDLVTEIERRGVTTAMAHVVCVGSTRAEMVQLLEGYREAGVVNLMVLGGDPPADGSPAASEFDYAIELAELAKGTGPFCVGVGAHPDGHPRSPDLASDRRHLADKLAVADFAVTQFFFEVGQWRRLVAELGDLGVTKPVIPGIMPITTLSGVERMAQMGARVPAWLVERLHEAHRRGGPRAVREAGIASAVTLCQELLAVGAPGLHFYTLNRSTATREIHAALFG